MIPVIFINCKLFPFVDWIMSGRKQYETRTRNTMKSLLSWALGSRFLIAETGHGDPVVRCSVRIDIIRWVRSRSLWEKYREDCCIPSGCFYDWKPDTKVKYLYHLVDVEPVTPFTLPRSCKRHGRVWAEYTKED